MRIRFLILLLAPTPASPAHGQVQHDDRSSLFIDNGAPFALHPDISNPAFDRFLSVAVPKPVLSDELFPRRQDYAWEGLAIGAAAGLILGVVLNIGYGSFEGERGLGPSLGTVGIAMAVTTPLGILIGGAIPKGDDGAR